MAALLHSSQLVFKVNASSAGLDHGFHQFESVEHTAKTGFGIGHDRREVVGIASVARVLAFHPLDLVGSGSRALLILLDDLRHRVDRIERLVGVHLTGQIGITCHLPTGQVNRLQARLDLLHGLVAGQGAERIHEGLGVDQVPEFLGATLGQGVINSDRTTQTNHFSRAVAALDAAPAGVVGPFFLQLLSFEFA